MGNPSKTLNSLAALGKALGVVEKPTVQEAVVTTRLINPGEIYNQHLSGGMFNNRFFLSPNYQARLQQVFNPAEAEHYTRRLIGTTHPRRFEMVVGPESQPEGIPQVVGVIGTEEYKPAVQKIDKLLMQATDPNNFLMMGRDGLSRKAIIHNNEIFNRAERAQSSKKDMILPLTKEIRYQALKEFQNKQDYNRANPIGYQRLFTEKGWNDLKKNLLAVPAAVSAAEIADMYFEDPVKEVNE